MGWVSHFDNNDWQVVSGAEWTGSFWSLPLTGGVARSQLEVIGIWYKNYFPKKVRLTISDDNSTLNIRSSGGLILASANPYPSGAEIDLSFGTSAASAFIHRIDLDWGVSPSATYQLEDIEFHEGSSSSSSLSSSSSSSSSLSSSSSSSSSSLSSSSSSSSLSSSSSSISSSSESCYIIVDDDFTGTNGDSPNVHRWEKFYSGTGDGPEIQDNSLRCSVGSGIGEEGVNSSHKFIGDFDFQVGFDIVEGADIGTQAWNAGLEARFVGDENNIARMSFDGFTTTYIGSSIVSGVPDSDASPTIETSGSFRVVRSGSTFYCYYQDSGWQLLHTKTIGTSACEVRLYVENSISYPLGTIDFDNFTATYDEVICAESSISSSSSSSSSISSSTSISSSSYSSCAINVNDDFTGSNFDPPDPSKWVEVITPTTTLNKALIIGNQLYWDGIKTTVGEEETSKWVSVFKMSQNTTWEVQIDIDWTDITAFGSPGQAGEIIFGYGNSAGTYAHQFQIFRGTWSVTDHWYIPKYRHVPGNHQGEWDNDVPPVSGTGIKVKFRWYGPDEGALYGRSTVWTWSNTRKQWEYNLTFGGVQTDGVTISSVNIADHHIILEYNTDIFNATTYGAIVDGTFDNFVVNLGDVVCAESSSSSSSVSSSSVSSSSSSISSSSSSISSSSISTSVSSSSSSISSSSSSSSVSSSSSSESSSSSSSESSSSSSSSSSLSSSSSSSFFDLARIHFWHYVLDEEGRPIQNSQIRLFLDDDPTTEANIYLTEIIPTYTTTSIANILTDNDGFFEFWLGSEWEDGGYPHTQSFRLEWYKAGTAPGVITDINPWPNAFSWIDTNIGADRDYRNKFASDFLANKWWTHTQALIPSASSHDLYPVDVSKGCVGSDNRYNKVVSNKFLNNIWTWAESASGETLQYGGINEHQETVTSWVPSSGVYYKDIDHSVSNVLSKSVTVQVTKLSDLRQVVPKKIINIDQSNTRVVMETSGSVMINIQGSSSSSTSSSSVSSSSSTSSSSESVVAPLVATEAYLYGTSGNINTARQIATSQNTTSTRIYCWFYQLGDWNIMRSWLVWDLSGKSGTVSSAIFKAWTSTSAIGWGSFGIVLVEGKTGWEGEGGGGGDMSANFSTWYWPGPGAETYWATTYLTDVVNTGSGSSSNIETTWTFNASGLALINSKIGTANWLEIVMVAQRDVDNLSSDTCNMSFWTEHHTNSDYFPVLELTFV